MIITYSTRTNKNGNTYQLKVDNENRTFQRGHFIFWGKGDVTTSRKAIDQLADNLKLVGYQEI